MRLGIGTGMLAFAMACGASEPRSEAATEVESVRVRVAEATRAESDRSHVATGTLRGRNTATVASRVMGHVRDLAVEPGQRVSAGDVLAVLDDGMARASLRQARAARNEADAARGQFAEDLNAAQAAQEIAQTTRDRMAALLAEGAVTQQRFDEADAQLRAARARRSAAAVGIARAESQRAQAGAATDLARTNLDYTRVRAPFDGLVLERPANLGDLVAPGAPLYVLEQDGALRAEVSVPESLAHHISIGDEVRLDVEAVGTEVTGRVDEVVPAVDARSRAFLVKATLPEARDDLRRGMFVRARFRLGSRDALVVPRDAISTRGALERVFVVEEGLARLRLVTVGNGGGESVEVLSGLDAGERVVLTPERMLDRQPVEVMQ